MSEQEKFDQWAIVELFGHQRIAGRVTEASIGGAAFIRVDVPDQPARKAVRTYGSDQAALPAFTRYFGGGAIYAINPCSEDIAKRACAEIRARPPMPFSIERPALNAPQDDLYDDDEEQP